MVINLILNKKIFDIFLHITLFYFRHRQYFDQRTFIVIDHLEK